MFRPNLSCTIERMTGHTGQGKRQYAAPVTSKCAIVYLTQMSQKTSVRTDSSGSHSFAREEVTTSRLLFPASIQLKAGDKITVMGFLLTVESIFPQHDVVGRHDHWQVECQIWQG